MENLKEVTYRPLSISGTFKATLNDGTCLVRTDKDSFLETKVALKDDSLNLIFLNSNDSENHFLSLITLEYLLGHHQKIQTISLEGIVVPFLEQTFKRSEFYQLPALWHHSQHYSIKPELWSETNGRAHPVRPRPHQGYVYKRFVPHLDMTISFRLITPEDLDTFHEWHNQPRVFCFWELNKPKEELKSYIEKGLQDPHQIPMIVEINGELVGYYEMYWVREDRLGPYYESDAFDRGFHFLIGNKKFLGHKITDSIIKSGLHLLFLDDARTRRIMAEPRHDNQKVLKYAEASIGWKNLKTFDFPHKRAVLLENSREIFFGGNAL